MARGDNPVVLQTAVVVEGGEVILRIFEDDSAVLTVRSAEREEKAEVGVSFRQSQVLVDMLQRIPGDGDMGDD